MEKRICESRFFFIYVKTDFMKKPKEIIALEKV